jgi:UDP-N-acetylmuramoylalanine-D-glutamate ligase
VFALFTNFTRDHLDYHGDMLAYEAAKVQLFDSPGLQHAVVNLDDPMGQRLVPYLQARNTPVTGYSLTAQCVEGLFQRVRRMGIIDHDQRRVLTAELLHPARYRRQRGQACQRAVPGNALGQQHPQKFRISRAA